VGREREGTFIGGYLEGGRNGGRRRHLIAHQNAGIIGGQRCTREIRPRERDIDRGACRKPNSTISLIEQGVGLQDFPPSSALYDYKT